MRTLMEQEAIDASNAKREAKHSSESPEWFTPVDVIARVRHVLGRIDLDPASTAKANELVRAERFFDERANGLAQPWAGKVFLNPPGGCIDADDRPVKYGKSSAKRWWGKLVEEYAAGRVEEAIFLGFNLDCLQNTQGMGPKGDGLSVAVMDFPFCIPAERIRFINGHTGVAMKQPTHANVIVYLYNSRTRKTNTDLFVEVFRSLGRVKV